ncbi:hypothetical protein DPMN_076835 [Dreissena polymorpha]|uniref:C-type lectin domain-containing protein n=1 Tax=Dreissena polymorpha TaxID=45954 RepID=A0A9D4BMR8_DREPO|nr:hypothetical protein DPMN_076835 [Dreissena polymorpha]
MRHRKYSSIFTYRDPFVQVNGKLEQAELIANPSSTWYDGYIKCRQSGLDMATWFDVTPDMNITYPIWLNGLEVRVNYLDSFFLIRKLPKNELAYVWCVNSTAFVDSRIRMTFEEGRKYNQNQPSGSQMDFPLVNHTNLHLFGFSSMYWYWIKAEEVGQFLNSEDLTAQCFVLKDIGDRRKDNCTNKYSFICVNATVHDYIHYTGKESRVEYYDPTSSRTPVTSSAVTSEFVTSLVTSETYIGVDVTTSAANTPFYLHVSTSDPKNEKLAKASSIIIWVSTTLGSCLVVLIVIIACLCIKRKQGSNARTAFQQNDIVLPSNVPQEGLEENSMQYDSLPDDITERKLTPYNSLQMKERHLYTASVEPRFMSTETSYVIGRIAESDYPVETQFEMSERQENNYDGPENDDQGDTNYDDVEVSKKDSQEKINTESEANMSYCFVK